MSIAVGDLVRELAPQVLGVLVRRHGQFDACEDAVQEALLDAARQWPEGLPDNPRGWLLTVATRRLTDSWRSESARRRRELAVAIEAEEPAPEPVAARDDSLTLLFLCCHPSLSVPSQLALTLRAVGGLSTAEIAAAFLVPEATMAQRVSRAKARIKGSPFGPPPEGERDSRLAVVLHVLYLIFNEGHTASAGPALHRPDLAAEAIRLTRLVHRLAPGDSEVAGLLALMLLVDARREARTTPDGALVPLTEQDRTRWDAAAIAEGTALAEHTMATGTLGPYLLQAAIAAVHAEPGPTDWPQILLLYGILDRLAANPVVTLNRAIALAMVSGPAAGLALVEEVAPKLSGSHRVDAVRGHLLELVGSPAEAAEAFERAARRTASLPEQRYLRAKARAARGGAPGAGAPSSGPRPG
ncbi:RNA polymerase sigma factor (sigma-70 family) [Crossiella equi]|uniref:RNA polymerase sigma factor (Sigma-70 family) n=1 Tax=Crossiella equi TaxID=130796 RepID=A0ABS5AMS8_9PSEU|nr:sigma-70 family RNA polymerase sigma factor [Crossiella equi]MBP2477883.1 RNA polymerase sigma factor (sigma-70 family) [Crossiella equi]